MTVYGTRGLVQKRQAYQLLAKAAEEAWGISPLPRIEREAGGKPFFPGQENRAFNLSHSGPLALCALDSAPVGVDVQVVKQWRPSLPRRVCSQIELDWLEKSPVDFWSRFTQLWALKECRVKQSGLGLRGPIAQISVPLPTAEHGLYKVDGLWFRCYTGPGWRGAVCGLGPPPEEICWLTLDHPSR